MRNRAYDMSLTSADKVPPQATRPAGNFDFYEKTQHGWICKTCGGEIKAVWKHAPVWDGPFPCSGSGEVTTWQAPYCPNCEVEP